LINGIFLVFNGAVDLFGAPDHRKRIGIKYRGMRILFGIDICMVHTVQGAVGIGIQVTGATNEVVQDKTNPLHTGRHRKHFVGCIPMQEEGLHKDGGIPMDNKQSENYNHTANSQKKQQFSMIFVKKYDVLLQTYRL
jgi:hypothetical protein